MCESCIRSRGVIGMIFLGRTLGGDTDRIAADGTLVGWFKGDGEASAKGAVD